MFHRKRAHSNPPTKTPPSAAASTAAVQAFLANRASNASLSNAAAVAALRSFPTSPLPVSEIRTKRMAQRRSSGSSNGSASGSLHRPNLRRRNSSGSMTERTFRDASSGHVASPGPQLQNTPPVPALPHGYVTPPPVPIKSVRRATSVEPSERFPKTGAAGRGVSLDRGPAVLPSRQNQRSNYRLNNLVNVDPDRVQTRDSINFSRPMSPQTSPATSPLVERNPGPLPNLAPSSSPPLADFRTQRLRDAEAESIRHLLKTIADRPVKRKKKMLAKEIVEGSHLANATGGGRPSGTALHPTLPRLPQLSSNTSLHLDNRLQASNFDDDATSVAQKRKKRRNIPPSTSQIEGRERPHSYNASDSDTQSERSFSDRPRNFNTRAAGLLVKQPSIVREEPEAEEEGEQETPADKINGQLLQIGNPSGTGNYSSGAATASQPATTSAGQPSKVIPPSVPATKTVTGIEKGLVSFTAPRDQSLSPARAAHFSSQPILDMSEGAKHQPPLRSVSPAKSALKHSARGASPGTWNRTSGQAPSEASDTTSVISDDGSKGAPRIKKEVRVSFDDDDSVGLSASPSASPDSPEIRNPQNSSRGWTTGRRDRREEVGELALDMDNKIQPTPTLPSFGSFRDRQNERLLDQALNIRSHQNQLQPLPNRYETSSDLAIGKVLAQNHMNKAGFNDPLPPEVNSEEGTGYQSESGDSLVNQADHQLSGANAALASTGNSPKQTAAVATNTNQRANALTSTGPIPSITVLPATPGIESPGAERQDWFRIPGQFPVSTESLSKDVPSAPSITDHHVTDQTPAEIGIAEPRPESTAAIHEAGLPAIGSVADGLRAQIQSHAADEEFEDSDESIYSDAAEDLSDFEGDGFGSINAIIEAPPVPRGPIAVLETLPDNLNKEGITKPRPSSLSQAESILYAPASDEGWNRSQAYWSGLNHTRSEGHQQAATPGAIDKRPTETITKPRANKSLPKETLEFNDSGYPMLPSLPDRNNRESTVSPKHSSMRQSMRSPNPENSKEYHMPSSMRTAVVPNQQSNRMQSLDAPPPRGALHKKSRPASAVSMADYTKAPIKAARNDGRSVGVMGSRAVKSTLFSPPASPNRKPATRNLRRTITNDSDSSSSFKRLRPPITDSNRYTMKRSMRPGSTDNQSQTLAGNRASTLSTRSPSPNGSTRRPFSSAGSGMQTSMRGPIDSGKKARTKSPSRFGFAKPAKSKKKTASKSGFSSRFADSSDEDARPVNRHSRFEDSSDDDDVPSRLTPVRGIPRRIDEEDSTDLEDSSAEPSPIRKPRANTQPTSKVQNLRGSTLAAASLRIPSNPVSTPAPMNPDSDAKLAIDTDKKKRSFFSGLGAKKRDDSRLRGPSERGTHFERPKAPRIFSADSQDLTVAGALSAKSPKLRRRNTPKRFMSDSWPLPDIPPPVDSRPHTSDGNGIEVHENGNGKLNGVSPEPNLSARGSAVQSNVLAEYNQAVVVKSRKKRFPMLRKALGLHD